MHGDRLRLESHGRGTGSLSATLQPSQAAVPPATAPNPATPAPAARGSQATPQAPATEAEAAPGVPRADAAPPQPAAAPPFDTTEAFAKLSPEQQQKVKNYFEMASAGADEAGKAALNKDMVDLLNSGALLDVETPVADQKMPIMFGQNLGALKPKTTLDRLDELTKAKLNGTIASLADKAAFARDLVHNLAHPETIGQGEGTLACAEATLEATLAYDQKADYARIAVQLATRGSASVPGHRSQDSEGAETVSDTEMALPSPLPPENAAGRNPVSYAVQSAFREYVAAKSPVEEYGVVPTAFAFGRKAGPKESQRPDEGLTGKQVKLLYDGILGQNHTLVYANPGTDVTKALGKALQKIKKDDPEEVIKVTMKNPDGSLHSIAVLDIGETGVSYWDPATRTIETLDAATFNAQVDRILLDPSLQKELAILPNLGKMTPVWFGLAAKRRNDGETFTVYGASDEADGFVDKDEGGGRGGWRSSVSG